MRKKIVRDIYKELLVSLTEREFLKELGQSKKNVLVFLERDRWERNAAEVVEGGTVRCGQVLEQCLETMDRLREQGTGEPQEGWLSYAYFWIMKGCFPESIRRARDPGADRPVRFFLRVLSVYLRLETNWVPFDPQLHFAFLDSDEEEESAEREEYRQFRRVFANRYVHEMMRLGNEVVSFNSLGHVGGVHHVAMHVARQLKKAGVSIDLGLVSGAAAGHDIGKYGCKPAEASRIPYLHYYYTDQWFSENGMPVIGHIAANHSTWDLELENLPVESLVLIYADFRVKRREGQPAGQREIMEIYGLSDSFHIILNKLDNVDDAKRDRYIHVYNKLKDFEDYMEGLGVNTDLNQTSLTPKVHRDPALFSSEEAVRALKHLAIAQNIEVMHRLGGEVSFGNVLEAARSEKDWKNSRAYLNIFEEYFTYLTQKQKLLTLGFLYELLMHREGDIRRQAGSLLGNIIVHYDEEYRKELPADAAVHPAETTSLELWEKYLRMIIYPDHKITDQHKRWIGYSLKSVMESVLSVCQRSDRKDYLRRVMDFYREEGQDDSTAFVLLDSMRLIPPELCEERELFQMQAFAAELSSREPLEIHVSALNYLVFLCEAVEQGTIDRERISLSAVKEILSRTEAEDEVSLRYLAERVRAGLGLPWEEDDGRRRVLMENPEIVSDLFLINLKAATPWIIKEVNIRLLLDLISRGERTHVLHIATHLCNLLKVSERIVVRHSAGRALVDIAPLLSLDQRNEIAIELTKGLEMGEYQYSKYIPDYLGQFALYLHPEELDEFIRDVGVLLVSRNDRVVSVAMDTLGILVRNYPAYRQRFPEETELAYRSRARRVFGMLLSGYSSYRETVRQEAMLIIGKMIFGDSALSAEHKRQVFALVCKKLLTLADPDDSGEISFFNRAASLNHLYRFLSDYLFSHKDFGIVEPRRVAFFPGTFDPFSSSHKGIVTAIRDLGYEVFLALDEFSWSKNTQPRMIRRQIIQMSIAGEEWVYLFPDELPVNIANPADLRRLKELFPNREVFMVVGSDVVENASSYKAKPVKDSVRTMNHIIFRRDSRLDGERGETGAGERPETGCEEITGKVVRLSLPVHLENISSTRIRENIDHNRDISKLIDPVAQNFIYSHGLYLREPQFKPMLHPGAARFEFVRRLNERQLQRMMELFSHSGVSRELLVENYLRTETGAVLLRNAEDGGRLCGAALFRPIGTAQLYGEFKDTEVTNFVRENTSGQIILVTGIFADSRSGIREAEQLLLTELLADALKRDFTYAVYHAPVSTDREGALRVLSRQGFFPVPGADSDDPVYAVDMKFPITLYKDISTSLKEPFNHLSAVEAMTDLAHARLQTAMTALYPGNLVLSFDAAVTNQHLLSLITEANEVPQEPTPVRQLGKLMCVPFGKVLRGLVVPNTVTKSLHTEKAFDGTIDEFRITEFPFYSPLETQIRTIRSFNRPVILVDDLMHKGYRMRELDPILKRERVEVSRIVVGLLSGRGKDLMDIQNRRVESAYFLPSLRVWFVESGIYPFLGGDMVRREGELRANLLPSINFILPYMSAGFLTGAPREAVYGLSMTCLENARDLLTVLEEEYQGLYERNLTLKRLGEVVIAPRVPDKGESVRYDNNRAPSGYVENDIEELIRLRNFL